MGKLYLNLNYIRARYLASPHSLPLYLQRQIISLRVPQKTDII